MEKLTQEELMEWLKPIQDPEIFMSLVELGLIYRAEMDEGGKVTVEMTLTSPGCPMGDHMVADVDRRLREKPEVTDAEVKIVWEPKWDPKEMASEECKEQLGIW